MGRDDPQLHFIDHAWSSTVHAAQGTTCDRVIAVLDADHGSLGGQASFYVELTRARDNAVLLTDDRDALVEALETSTPYVVFLWYPPMCPYVVSVWCSPCGRTWSPCGACHHAKRGYRVVSVMRAHLVVEPEKSGPPRDTI